MPPDKEIRGCPAPGAKARLKASKPIGRYMYQRKFGKDRFAERLDRIDSG